MNAQHIRIGEEYAFVYYRYKGIYPTDGLRCKVINISQSREWGNQNRSTRVTVSFDGEKGQRTATVDARNIIDFWEDYVGERDAIIKEREEKHQRQREAIAEKHRRDQALITALREKIGFPEELVSHVGATSVTLNREELEEWLEVE